MLSKSRYPHMNRAQRRHPQRFAQSLQGSKLFSNWLLAGLLLRGGYLPKVNEEGAQV